MMNKKLFFNLSFICAALFLFSCNNIKDLEYKGVAKSSLKKASLTNTDVQLDLKYFNPNSFGVDVKDADLEVFVDDKLMGTADFYSPTKETAVIHIPKKQEFIIPVIAHIDALKAMGSAMKLLTNPKINLGIKGTTKVGKGGVFIKIPIRVNEQIDLKNFY